MATMSSSRDRMSMAAEIPIVLLWGDRETGLFQAFEDRMNIAYKLIMSKIALPAQEWF